MRRTTLRAALAVGLGLVAATGCAAEAEHADVSGRYRGSGDVRATLEVTDNNGDVHLVLSGGGSSSLGGAAPADCIVKASGRFRHGELVAGFEAVDTDLFSYDEAQAKAEHRTVTIRFDAKQAIIQKIDIDGYCGLGVRFVGSYEKKT